MSDCLIAFGGNLSNPKVTFQIALDEMCDNGLKLIKKSGLWRSAAWPAGSGQPPYLNAVVKGQYDGDALSLLSLMQSIETKHGRVRSIPNAARTLDLDLLTFGAETRVSDRLNLPHPRMLDRTFVLLPASELEPKWLEAAQALPLADIRATKYVGSW